MAFWLPVLFGISVALKFLKPRVKRTDAPDLEFPKTEEGLPLPLIYGTQAIAPLFNAIGEVTETEGSETTITFYESLAVGDLCLGEIAEIVDIQFGGKSLRLHPFTRKDSTSETDDKYAITLDGAPTLPGLPYVFGAENFAKFNVNARQLFGGQNKEGGVERVIHIHKGSLTDVVDPVTAHLWEKAKLLGGGPAYPGCAYISFGLPGGHFYWGTRPQPKSPVVIVKVIPNGLGLGAIGNDANPAEIIYDLLTHALRGQGIDPRHIDFDSFTACGQQLLLEGLGLSCTFDKQRELQDMIEEIGQYIHGDCYQSALTGKWTMVLARDDYENEDLEEINRSFAADLKITRPSYRETTNEVKVVYRKYDDTPLSGTSHTETVTVIINGPKGAVFYWGAQGRNITNVTVYNSTKGIFLAEGTDYQLSASGGVFHFQISGRTTIDYGDILIVTYTNGTDLVGYKEATELAQDLANQQGTKELRTVTLQRPFFTLQTNASIHAWRELKIRTRPLAEASWTEDRHGYARKPNDVVALTWVPEDGDEADFTLERVPFRINSVNYGSHPGSKITITAVEDAFGASVLPSFSTGGGNVIGQLIAPGMAIGCGLGGTDVRIALFPSDTNFTIRLWQADDATGLNRVLVDDFVGTTLYYDTATTGKYYQAQLVRAGFDDGALTLWITCSPDGPPVVPECETPSYSIVADTVAGSIILTLTDTQNRVPSDGVEFRSRSGSAPWSDWAATTIGDDGTYTSVVELSVDHTSRIEWRITYQACSGDDDTLESGYDFLVVTPPPEPPEPINGLTRVVVEIPLHSGASLPLGMDTVPSVAEPLTPWRATEDKFPLEDCRGARISATIDESSVPAGTYVAVQFEPIDAPGTWQYLDGDSGPLLAIDEASLLAADLGSTALPSVVVGEWVAVIDFAAQDVRFRGVIFGGDGDVTKVVSFARLAVQFRIVAGNQPPPFPPPEIENPGSCTEAAPLDSLKGYANEAALEAVWAEDTDVPAESTWTADSSGVTLGLTGNGTGQATRAREFEGFTPSELLTVYLDINPSDLGPNAFVRVGTGDRVVATETGNQTVAAQGDADADGKAVIEFGVEDAGGGPSSTGSDALDQANNAAAVIDGWTVSGAVSFGSGVAVHGSSPSVGWSGNGFIQKDYAVSIGQVYRIRLWVLPNTNWWRPLSLQAVSGGIVADGVNGSEPETQLDVSITAAATTLTVKVNVGTGGTFNATLLTIDGLGGGATVSFKDLGFCEGSGIGGPEIEQPPEPPEPPVPPTEAPTRPFGAFGISAGGYSYWDCTIKYTNKTAVVNLINQSIAADTFLMITMGADANWLDSSGNFSFDLWKISFDNIYNDTHARAAIEARIPSGKLWHHVIDEPHHPTRYGGPIPLAVVERMCQYSKLKYPLMTTACAGMNPRTRAYYITRHIGGLDHLWGEYSLKGGPPDVWRDELIAKAAALGHGIVLGIHYLDFSGVLNNRYITPSELRHYGGIIADTSLSAGFVGWKYYLAMVNQVGFFDALRFVRDKYVSVQ